MIRSSSFLMLPGYVGPARASTVLRSALITLLSTRRRCIVGRPGFTRKPRASKPAPCVSEPPSNSPRLRPEIPFRAHITAILTTPTDFHAGETDSRVSPLLFGGHEFRLDFGGPAFDTSPVPSRKVRILP